MSSSPFFPASCVDASLEILVVDDMAEVRELVGLCLRAAGHRVHDADCGDAAVRILQERHLDLVITDVLMPDGDGLDVITQARRLSSVPRVIAISGGGRYMTGTDCLRVAQGMGADGVLMKPFNRAQLFAAIDALRPRHEHAAS